MAQSQYAIWKNYVRSAVQNGDDFTDFKAWQDQQQQASQPSAWDALRRHREPGQAS